MSSLLLFYFFYYIISDKYLLKKIHFSFHLFVNRLWNEQTTEIKTMKTKTRLILDHRKLLMLEMIWILLLNSGAR